MTSVLNVDEIAAKNGTSPVALTKQSAAKAWANFDGTGTIAFRDSLNHSTLTDSGTGKYDISLTSSMDNNDYSLLTGVGRSNSNYYYGGDLLPSHFLTTGYSLSSINTAGSALDFEVPTSGILGDLA